MPIQIIATDGLIDPDRQQSAFSQLTNLLLSLHGLAGNDFMTPAVIGEVTSVPAGKTFSAGEPEPIAILALTVPSFVLATPDLKAAWIEQGTDIIEKAAEGKLPRSRIFANISYAVDGGWGIAGKAYSNTDLGDAIQKAAAA